MISTPDPAVEAYFAAWRARDAARLREVLAPDVNVVGPLGEINGAFAYERALARVFEITRSIDIAKQWTDGGDTLTWFDLHHTNGPSVVPVANWVHVENNLITRVRIAFDAHAIFGSENL